MFRKFAASVNSASKWADTADRNAVLQTLGELLFSLVKIFFAFTHFIEFLLKAALARLFIRFNRKVEQVRDDMEKNKAARLRDRLNWNEHKSSAAVRNPYSRR